MDLILTIENLTIAEGQASGDWCLTTENGYLVNSDYVDIEAMIAYQLSEKGHEVIDFVMLANRGDNARHSGWFVATLCFNPDQI